MLEVTALPPASGRMAAIPTISDSLAIGNVTFADLVCPVCRGALVAVKDMNALGCVKGHGPWSVREGVPLFHPTGTDHEKRWSQPYRDAAPAGRFHGMPRRHAHWGIPALLGPMLERAGTHPLRILDLGCGGGWEFLTRFGSVTGVDKRLAALKAAARVYDRVVGSALPALPFAHNAFDVVTHVWFAEHLTETEFSTLLQETRRVLRPGGHLIFFCDLHSSKPILRWAREHPVLYRRHHVEAVGHYGLRSLSATRFLLRKAGFTERESVPLNKSSLLQPVTALWMFDNPLGRASTWLRLYVSLCRRLRRSYYLHRAVYLALMAYHRWVDRQLPDAYAFSAAWHWTAAALPPAPTPTVPGVPRTCVPPLRWHPVAVVVDNAPNALPQEGIGKASIVIEAPVEGWRTRLLAIYLDRLPKTVGPVRSARPYFIDWAEPFEPFFLHCGASPGARARLAAPRYVIGVELRYDKQADGTFRPTLNKQASQLDPRRCPPHLLMARPRAVIDSVAKLTLALPDARREAMRSPPAARHIEPDTPSYRFTGETTVADTAPRHEVIVRQHPGRRDPTRFQWSAAERCFYRWPFRRSGLPGWADRAAIATLVVMETDVARIPGDPRGRVRVRTHGDGPLWMWRGPEREEGSWRKTAGKTPLEFLDVAGQPMRPRSGLTWIVALGPDGYVEERGRS